ncbi:MAG: hypothetical protein J6S42_04280 [Thermoguttaceae bacterium]|nr:hypothetical protein [Thermoguttaceae bacterium]
MTEENRGPLTEEDLFRLELLADGELDEESRRDLLERLDRTADGWRQCALAFLQAQCLGESFDESALWVGAADGEPELSYSPVPSDEGIRSDREYGGVPMLAGAAFSEKKFASPIVSAPCPQSAGDVCAGPEAEFAVSRTARRRASAFSGVRVRRTAALLSSACALLLVGLVGLNFYLGREKDASRQTGPNEPFFAEETASDAAIDRVPAESFERNFKTKTAAADAPNFGSGAFSIAGAENDLLTENAGEAESIPLGLGVSAPAGAAVPAAASGDKIQYITIRRPGGSNEISVPCVEAESYVSDNSASEALAKNYRDAGCQVETLHEELEFRLQNGKTVIVPVDTIDVQRAPSRTYFL